MGCKVKQVEATGSRKQRKQRKQLGQSRKKKELREVTGWKRKQESTWKQNEMGRTRATNWQKGHSEEGDKHQSGRPKLRWNDCERWDLGRAGVNSHEWMAIVDDSKTWKELIRKVEATD